MTDGLLIITWRWRTNDNHHVTATISFSTARRSANFIIEQQSLISAWIYSFISFFSGIIYTVTSTAGPTIRPRFNKAGWSSLTWSSRTIVLQTVTFVTLATHVKISTPKFSGFASVRVISLLPTKQKKN